MSDVEKASTLYPVRVYFWTPEPETLITAGFDSLRVERRDNAGKPWKTVSIEPYALALEVGRYNYNWTDHGAERASEYRAVLQNSVTPGTPADVPHVLPDTGVSSVPATKFSPETQATPCSR